MQWEKSLHKGDIVSGELSRCSGCGALLPGGKGGCVGLYNELLARDYTNALYACVHMLMVDCHSLQHPEDHGVKSNAAHLLSLCWQVEYSLRPGTRMPEWIRKEFDGKPDVEKLAPPRERGRITVADVHGSKNSSGTCCAGARLGCRGLGSLAHVSALGPEMDCGKSARDSVGALGLNAGGVREFIPETSRISRPT